MSSGETNVEMEMMIGDLSSKIVDDDNDNNEEVEVQWAAIEKLPTIKRLRTSLFDGSSGGGEKGRTVVDVAKLGAEERQFIVHKLINHVEEDNRRLLLKMKQRMDRVGVKQPTVEVRFQNLKVESECVVVNGKPLPTLWNTFKSIFSVFAKLSCCKSQKAKLSIINGVSGIIKPSRMTLLLGPPGCGKTTLLKALAGELDHSLKVKGEIYYNSCKLENLMAQKTSAYISQYDLYLPEMTVRETIDFSARCQGVQSRTEIMLEVSRREKEAGIIPEPDIDTYMKATSISGLEKTIQTDYTLKILGLDICADTIVGDAMKRGISGGQQRRLATGEMIVGPRRAFFMDEISNGLDSSTTFQIITCLQQLVHITDATALISLLQPAPETFELFDDIILYAEGKIVYHGPRRYIIKFFENCGFKCPKRKGVADFLQEVISRKDQPQYWYNDKLPYQYVSIDEFSENFKACPIGQQLHEELSKTNDYSQSGQNVLSHSKYSISNWELFKACLDREILLMRRNSSLHIFRLVQLVVTGIIAMTIFLGSRMEINLKDANYYLGSLFYGALRILTNGIGETSVTVSKLPVFYQQRDFNLYPAWAYSVPAFLLKIPLSLVESFIWTALTYYVMGYSPEVERFFSQFLIFFALHQTSIAMFRFLASICQTEVPAIFCGSVTVLVMLLFSGFIIPLSSLPTWLKWGFWTTPVSYAAIGVSVNEFLAPRWMKETTANQTIGQETLSNHSLNFEGYFYWVSLGALFGLAIVFNIGLTLALTFLNSPGTSTTFVSHEKRTSKNCKSGTQNVYESRPRASLSRKEDEGRKARMALHFEPLTLTFQNIQYSVDTPQEMRKQGFGDKELQLLHDITGAFRPGKLTALMGESGAGKTTLMDVLAGRKTTGYIKGAINVGGSPKIQETFARVSGYCEQSDIHSPQITVEESVIFSAWLRLPSEVDADTRAEFVKDVLERIELDEIKNSLVGIPGKSGLSNEQRKRLTIAVELVSNPSIIFMDEPTSGLDARAAAIVMRAVKNVVETGRTVVCTIHQPNIDIFEAFDELILMKKGGQIVYSGQLGEHSSELIQYFEGIPGVPRIKENYNPATWMLEIITTLAEAQLGLDFAQVYKESPLHQSNIIIIEELAKPQADSEELHFPTLYPQNSWEQFKACLWKQNLSYWRSPAHLFTRLMFVTITSVLIAALMWQKGKKLYGEQDLLNIIGSIYIVMQMLGVNTCASIIPVIATERTVLYREKFAGMYSSWVFSFAQVAVEVPYILVQTTLFVTITYPAMGLHWSVYKVIWYFYTTLCHFLFYSYFGMLLVSISPNGKIASMLGTASYTLLNLFSGYLIPGPGFPKWWVWLYWISPTSWSLRGIITSQYGDIEREITAFGVKRSVVSFLGDYFGFHHNQLALVAAVLAIFPVLVASLFAFSVQKLNFQRR